MSFRRFCVRAVFPFACLVACGAPLGGAFPAGQAGHPASFEANTGQAAFSVRFLARGPSGSLALTSEGAWLTLQDQGQGPGAPRVVGLKLGGANPHPWIEGVDPLPGKANYLGGDPGQTRVWTHFP